LALDPRSLLYTRRLARLLNYTRRYDDAEALLTRARTQSPNDPSVILYQAWLKLSQGDLAGAKAVARSIPKDANEPTVLSFFSSDWSSAQLLDEDQRQLLLRLQPSQFGDNRGGWGLALAYAAYMKGDARLVRAYADSALPSLERAIRENPGEPSNHAYLGLAQAFLGRKADAIREGESAVAIGGSDGFQGPGIRSTLSHIYQLVGEPVKAIEQLEILLRVPNYVSPGWLRASPSLEALRSQPRFQRLLAMADSLAK
jgi:tetratricopeptide (TPR) repeat protein